MEVAPHRHPRLSSVLSFGLLGLPSVKRAARRACAAGFRLLLRSRSRPYICPGRVVTFIIAPHPDDEALGCAGLIAAKRQAAQPIHLIYLTDGGGSHAGHPTLARGELVASRTREARQAMALLGVEADALHFLGAPDGQLGALGVDETRALTDRLRTLLVLLAPAELFLPCRRDGSSEHEAGFRLVTATRAGLSPAPRLLEYPVWSWWNAFRLLSPLWHSRQVLRVRTSAAQKARVIACYRSQVEPTAPWTYPVMPRDFVALLQGSVEFFFVGR